VGDNARWIESELVEVSVPEGFVIMQIGNDDLDRMCDEVIFPAIQAAELEPRRVDRHNTGDLLKSEIVAFIEQAEIIVADLTNERPNVYLEIGYAMGLGKKTNLILTARADHFPGHPDYQQVGKRIHFDLQGYDILRWDPNALDGFREELIGRIRRRRALLAPPATAADAVGPMRPAIDQEWLDHNREVAHAGLQAVGLPGFWETVVAIQPRGDWPQQALRDAVAASTIRTWGWPIGISFDRDGQRPQPTAGGVVAEVAFGPGQLRSSNRVSSYDYWNLQRTGDFYYLRSVFEDEVGRTTELFFNTRIVQVTEMLLFLARLYGQQLRLSDTTMVSIKMTHGGLAGRYLNAIGARGFLHPVGPSVETQIETQLTTTVGDLEAQLVENVKTLLTRMFALFDYTVIADPTWTDIVDRFVGGEVS
jgi:hypothetical protein